MTNKNKSYLTCNFSTA